MRTVKGLMVIFSFIVMLVAAFVFGVNHGKVLANRAARNQLLLDAQVAQKEQHTILLEYIKHKYYFHSNRSRVKYRSGEGDFGPVDETLLKPFYPGKEIHYAEEYSTYKSALSNQ